MQIEQCECAYLKLIVRQREFLQVGERTEVVIDMGDLIVLDREHLESREVPDVPHHLSFDVPLPTHVSTQRRIHHARLVFTQQKHINGALQAACSHDVKAKSQHWTNKIPT